MALAEKLLRKPRLSAFFLGGITAAGFAPLFFWPLSLLSLGGVFMLLFSAKNPYTIKDVLFPGWLFGVGFSLASLWWMGAAFRYTGLGGWALAAAPFAILGLSAVMGLWYMATFALAAAVKKHLPKWLFPVALALAWVLMEAVRTQGVYGLPWHLAGYIFAGNLYLIQAAAFGSVLLLSFLAVLLPAAVALTPRQTALIYGALVVCVFGGGAYRVINAPDLSPRGTVSLYHTSLAQDVKWQTPSYKLAHQTIKALQQAPHAAQLVILPETVFTFLKQAAPDLSRMVAEALPQKTGAVFGIPSFREGIYGNTALSVSAEGDVLGSYSKKLLVPFGEFIPLQEFMPAFLKQFAPANAYSAGSGARVLETSIGTGLPVICYEVIFPYHIRQAQKQHNPLFMVNLTNDGWFAGTSGPHQHNAIARLRSVETGLSQVRATNKGISGFIDGYGRVTYRSDVGRSGFLTGSVFEQAPTFGSRK